MTHRNTSHWLAVFGRAAFRGAGFSLFILLQACGCTRTLPGPGKAGDRIALDAKEKRLVVEVACDSLSRQLGLMNRPSLPENEGMLFLFPQLEKQSFWMKNTLIPLSIAFLEDGGKILQIEDMKPKDESPTLSKYPVRYALEVNQGWFQRNGIAVGDAFSGFATKIAKFKGR